MNPIEAAASAIADKHFLMSSWDDCGTGLRNECLMMARAAITAAVGALTDEAIGNLNYMPEHDPPEDLPNELLRILTEDE